MLASVISASRVSLLFSATFIDNNLFFCVMRWEIRVCCFFLSFYFCFSVKDCFSSYSFFTSVFFSIFFNVTNNRIKNFPKLCQIITFKNKTFKIILGLYYDRNYSNYSLYFCVNIFLVNLLHFYAVRFVQYNKPCQIDKRNEMKIIFYTIQVIKCTLNNKSYFF